MSAGVYHHSSLPAGDRFCGQVVIVGHIGQRIQEIIWVIVILCKLLWDL